MTGANFAKTDDSTLRQHADYWAKNSNRPLEDALSALAFLKIIFSTCSKSNGQLLKSSSTLQRRIGLLKQHADRSAAHLSMENYEFDILDVAHVIAALVIVGEIIRSFDSPYLRSDYFNILDEGAHVAVQEIFSATPPIRLFESMKVEQQAKGCWQWGEQQGMHMLLEQLPFAVGWF